MTPGDFRVSRRSLAEIPPQNVMPARVTGARISLRYEISQQYHVNAKRPLVSVSNRSAGRLEYGTDSARRASIVCDFEPRMYFNQHEVYLQIDQVTMQTRYEIKKSSGYETRAEFSHVNTPLKSCAKATVVIQTVELFPGTILSTHEVFWEVPQSMYLSANRFSMA